MVRIFDRLWYNCDQTKNHRPIGGDLSQNGGPNRDRTDDPTDANESKAVICIDFIRFRRFRLECEWPCDIFCPLFPRALEASVVCVVVIGKQAEGHPMYNIKHGGCRIIR